ncbi:MAG: hypothetical protein V1915_02570 [Candidatus Bathyarchaeota archaeon]
MNSRLNVKILRKVTIPLYAFIDYFKGFEKVEAVKQIFKDKTEEVLLNLKVEFNSGRGYMGVSDADGHLRVSVNYLRNGDLVDIYLDVIHELVHVRQFMDGKKLFDENFKYVDRPTEIEAYHHAVDEARNLGMNEEQILDYLRTDRRTDEDLYRLAKNLNVKVEMPLRK